MAGNLVFKPIAALMMLVTEATALMMLVTEVSALMMLVTEAAMGLSPLFHRKENDYEQNLRTA